MIAPNELNDNELLEQIENCTLSPSFLTHDVLLRLTWILIHEYGLEKAMLKNCEIKEQYFKKALKKYKTLAKHGDSFSQFRVSTMYLNGQGTKVSENDAYGWSVLAAQAGDLSVLNIWNVGAGNYANYTKTRAGWGAGSVTLEPAQGFFFTPNAPFTWVESRPFTP